MSGTSGAGHQWFDLISPTENAKIARHLYELLSDPSSGQVEIVTIRRPTLQESSLYISRSESGGNPFLICTWLTLFGIEAGIDQAILSDDEASRAYLRGPSSQNGSMREPDSGKYQLEILSVYLDHAEDLAALMRRFLLDPKTIERKKGAVTYLQRAEDIMDFSHCYRCYMEAMAEF